MGTINAAWHGAHRMPKNATTEQRIEWHVAHAANCACRNPPPGLLALLQAKGIVLPQVRPGAQATSRQRRAKRGSS